MKTKKVHLSSEDKKKLLQLMAEEEKKLDALNLSDDELANEEQQLSQDLSRLLSDAPDEATLTESSPNQQQNWQRIQEKLSAKPATELPISSNVVNLEKHRSKGSWRWMGGMVAAAALVLIVVNQQPGPVSQDAGYSGFKGQGHDGQIDCDYKFVAGGDLDVENGIFLVPQGQPVNLEMDCRGSSSGYVHLRIAGDVTVSQVINARIDSAKGYVTDAGEVVAIDIDEMTTATIFVTAEPVAEGIQLPSSFTAEAIGSVPVGWGIDADLKLKGIQ
ncbi:hypothetical protein [Pseudobacteriovorax antillogorgiicola]|uniref:Uncharacterized protein n=1 Tax=Pseudobacteriovorax antillogorgiicola TaxID=1513793 RepID=A0A1Y6CW93_9BACT|nr:hypothetical protein [Pseudobacteriovorax antillogorgiicola]TCS44391.1 hypothetical protein EDD56_13318 [Pseudobacteriovorax antillogorgiicola]SMF79326.1 hypothetical protein SAMN06296036_13356 [Pseudobacteriovorax antillogorgiicola]